MSESIAPDFEALAAAPDERLDLARIALLIAADGYPAVEIEKYVGQLDSLAKRVREYATATGRELLDGLDHVLFVEEGFAGNSEAYYDPRNSFLNEVLDRRVGIPITLSLVFLEVGWRAGLPLTPVSFPTHFLVALQGTGHSQGGAENTVFIDPFHGGERLATADVVQRLVPLLGNNVDAAQAYLPRVLAASSRREMAVRMLRNLKAIYTRQDDVEPLLTVCNRMIALAPGDAAALRDRGATLARLECHQSASHDFEHYLRLAPNAEDAPAVREQLARCKSFGLRLH